MSHDQTLKVYFGEGCANLYTIGYISSDLFQLLAFSELLEQRDEGRLYKYFLRKERPLYLSRYSKLLRENIKTSQVTDVKKGSVELIISCVTVASAIIIPFVVLGVHRRFERSDQQVTFNVATDDQTIQQNLDEYSQGTFGHGVKGLDAFVQHLAAQGYDVHAVSERVYEIEHVVDRYERRLARTLKMN